MLKLKRMLGWIYVSTLPTEIRITTRWMPRNKLVNDSRHVTKDISQTRTVFFVVINNVLFTFGKFEMEITKQFQYKNCKLLELKHVVT